MKIVKATCIVIFITGLLAGVFFSSSVSAQDISGVWHGKLSLPTGSLTIVFHISQTEQGGYVTTLDSPDQGANGIKTQTTSFNDSTLIIQIPMIHASYKGKLNSDNTINGTFTQGMPLPLNLKKGEASRPKRPQEPQPPFPYRSEEVTVRNERDGINLAGTLTLPEKGTKFPAIVMVTGSGAQNRDEEIMGHKPFFVIADYLTRNGIAVLRCDDRGTAASQGTHATATNEDFATDTEAMVNYLRSRKEINAKKIGIIGHSAGGIIAFIVAAKDPSIAFVVSLAGAGVRGDSLMLKQVELISKSQGMPDAVWQGMKPSIRNRYAILQQTDKTPEELQKELYADITKTMSPEQLKDLNTIQQLSAQISSMTSPWYLHFMRYDPAQDLKKLKCPVLALNGEKDIQVDATMNLAAIQERITGNGNKNVTVKAYPNLNHLFQTCEKGTLAEYGQLEETINPEVLKDIIEWIRKQ
ncbi:alpha/beta hydrolase family protein [Bacteroides xylanisolvens]|uniref:alpha/beta hydrolase family protein n=1 Tax=Bacteroides xylanisolvens TaxID=371601 RepID=UPI00374E2824